MVFIPPPPSKSLQPTDQSSRDPRAWQYDIRRQRRNLPATSTKPRAPLRSITNRKSNGRQDTKKRNAQTSSGAAHVAERKCPGQEALAQRKGEAAFLKARARPPNSNFDGLWEDVRIYNKSIMPKPARYAQPTRSSKLRSGGSAASSSGSRESRSAAQDISTSKALKFSDKE